MVTNPKNSVDACEEFFVLAVHAHTDSAAMQFLGMQTLDDGQ